MSDFVTLTNVLESWFETDWKDLLLERGDPGRRGGCPVAHGGSIARETAIRIPESKRQAAGVSAH
jgi:hypothetical protein